MNATHLNQTVVARLAADSDFAEDVRYYGERYLEHRRLAAAPTLGYSNAYAFAAWGRPLAELLEVSDRRDLPSLTEAALAAVAV